MPGAAGVRHAFPDPDAFAFHRDADAHAILVLADRHAVKQQPGQFAEQYVELAVAVRLDDGADRAEFVADHGVSLGHGVTLGHGVPLRYLVAVGDLVAVGHAAAFRDGLAISAGFGLPIVLLGLGLGHRLRYARRPCREQPEHQPERERQPG
jgi:hypothetical protein